MADKHQREIPLDDKLLASMIVQRGELVAKGRAISTQMEDLAKQHEKLAEELSTLTVTVNNKKLEIFRRAEKLAKKLLGEFEIPVTTDIKNGKVVLIVTEALEEFKESFKRFDKWHQPVPRREKKLEAKK